ncbi:MAG: Hsp20/alpha crystallin family protein [Synechococcus sp.]|uniref:Hsp20/alpha crystallin family protein n=1 Tax=Synechococcus sp. PROS-9-1 TaxID=1968775 RepID=UPI000E085CDE|nr:Hsp20/alpha crystallin family protein [Synechococcus sp. PROS-9-1]MBC8169205.1 Hsp20/alpha crystallin family protein [Synechococcus sp.]MBL6888506.1 Hsp20/alpha crystallin family protein [Synechococcus sp. BS30m-G30]MDC0315569.1 Hsp20/alpha crystallin family protein [Synechococcus sp. AH-551-G15]RCL58834.1 MAG: Hsp20/alpha crystallin family protein [Synechococcus sp. MED-G68]QNJ33020.1 small heat shock protein (HSP20) family protein [Synechococcus sp. PROS-9-1]|tara:strand:+ start:521 stop:949 length:429 start_codon:yes stop_codon:yes gene_type:complete
MITLRTSPFDLLDRLEQQVSQAERVPAAEVIETNTSYTVRLELPGVDHESIDVKATDRSLVISAERQPTIPVEDNTTPTEVDAEANAQQLLSEFRTGTWSRSFRFAKPLDRDQLEASYRDGILEIRAAKSDNRTTVSVKVES